MIRLFVKAANEVVYVANAYRLLLEIPFLMLQNRRLKKQIKRMESGIEKV